MGTVLAFTRDRASPAKPVTWAQVTDASDEFRDWCLMLLEQTSFVRSGHTIDVPKNFPVASIKRAQDALKDRGYPTTFQEGGEFGWGFLFFM